MKPQSPLVRLWVVPFVIALAIIAVQTFKKPLKAPELDEFYYLTIARDLALHGTFTDGSFKGGPFGRRAQPDDYGDEDPKWAQPGRFFTPAYPALVYAIGRIDSRVAEAVRCHVFNSLKNDRSTCSMTFETLIAAHVLLWAIAMVAIFQIGWQLSSSETVAWLAMIIALASGETGGYFARTYLSENLIVPLFCLFLLFSVRAIDDGTRTDFTLAGIFFGLAALSRPGYIYLFYALVPVLLAVSAFSQSRSVPKRSHLLLFTLACGLVLLPWMARNYMTFGDPKLSAGYAEVILTQRLSYNQMSWSEWVVAFVYWLPDFGDGLAKSLFPRDLWYKLGWSEEGYYMQGAGGSFKAAVKEANPQDETVLNDLLRTYIFGDMVKHVGVTLPLTVRGMGVGKYAALAGWVLAWPAFRLLHSRGKALPFLVLVFPPLFMAGLHGFVSVNITRYNVPIIAVYAISIAVVAQAWIARIRSKPN